MDTLKKTAGAYGFLWTRDRYSLPAERWHFNAMQEVIPEPIVRGRAGIDIGTGCGYDAYIMARNNPSVRIIGIDISDGIYTAAKLASGLDNACMIKSSAINMPAADSVFDFAYSFGVLHHIPNPVAVMLEMRRVLKSGCPCFLYLYEDHSKNPLKYAAIKTISCVRRVTTLMPARFLYFLCWLFSPLVFAVFTMPSKAMKAFRAFEHLADKVPFNFGAGFFSLTGDLYDRFSAPVEHRFSERKARGIFTENGFTGVRAAKLKGTAGWVVWGYKGND